jgi:uncharacterized protein
VSESVVTGALELDLVEKLVRFCRALREQGLSVTTGHANEAARALSAIGLGSPQTIHLALRCVLCQRPEEFPVFDELFSTLFALPAPGRRPKGPESRSSTQLRKPPAREEAPPSLAAWTRSLGQAPETDEEEEPQEVPGASPEAATAQKDFSSFSADELEEIERMAARLARKLAARPSRRWKAARKGPRVDLRRTIRRSIPLGAEVAQLVRRQKKPRRTRIVALCDVSGSMDLYSRFLLQFLYALQGSVARVESFVFSTRLQRVTGALRERPFGAALRQLSRSVDDWSGGTRIGECLAAFARDFDRLLDKRTVLLILSDGWDTGEPALLSEAMESLRRQCRRLIWLNPLLGSPGYEPATVGMLAALPHVSVFAPAHNLESLRQLERHLLR